MYIEKDTCNNIKISIHLFDYIYLYKICSCSVYLYIYIHTDKYRQRTYLPPTFSSGAWLRRIMKHGEVTAINNNTIRPRHGY